MFDGADWSIPPRGPRVLQGVMVVADEGDLLPDPGRWRDGSVQVDGVAIPARLLTHDDADVGVARFVRGGRGVLVVAERIDLDRFALVGLVEPAPLVDEFELRRRRIFPQSGG